jgi:hypothetical protein
MQPMLHGKPLCICLLFHVHEQPCGCLRTWHNLQNSLLKDEKQSKEHAS